VSFRTEAGVRLGGWDGFCEGTEPNPFVAVGLAGWEFSVQKDGIAAKATEDFNKRAAEPDAAQITFVFLTSRRWSGKHAWTKDRVAEGMDPVVAALWVGGICGLLVIITAGVIMLANRESETIFLGFAASFGALLVFGALGVSRSTVMRWRRPGSTIPRDLAALSPRFGGGSGSPIRGPTNSCLLVHHRNPAPSAMPVDARAFVVLNPRSQFYKLCASLGAKPSASPHGGAGPKMSSDR
jgi:hypothetical protein